MVHILIKETSSQAKNLIEFLKTMPFVEFLDTEKKPYKITLEAMKEAKTKNKKLKTFSNTKYLFKELNK